MASRMMRWRPWPPITWRKFSVNLNVMKIEGVSDNKEEVRVLSAEIRWKGPKLGFLRRSMKLKRNCTKEEEIKDGFGFVEWNEEFESFCTLGFYKESGFLAWEIEIRVFNGTKQGSKNKPSIIGTATLNLAEFASSGEENIELNLPLMPPEIDAEPHPSLHLTLSLTEMKPTQEASMPIQRSIVPTNSTPPSVESPHTSEKDELSALKAGLRKVKYFTELVSARKAKTTYKGDSGSSKSDDIDYPYPFDTDSLDDDEFDLENQEIKEDSHIRKSFSYGTLATANNVGSSIFSDMIMNGEFEDWVYYSHRRSDVGCSNNDVITLSSNEEVVIGRSKRSILPWKRRKLSFRSPKAKGEPLLKKGNDEEGGDDIDYDRRLLSSSDESHSIEGNKVSDNSTMKSLSLSDFGDDNFAIGSWETKEITSRDNQMKLLTRVFFASIDQRSERAAGESACTALVAVVANWFQLNPETMPIKSQFDSLIREGSLEWRKLCNNVTYMEKFPDKHFDLETILQAKIRPLSVIPEKSFIGFFQPENLDSMSNSGFDFLHGAMSFDNIWDEISRGPPQIYIVSWNDHFFVLKVEGNAYYIVDTLGERLFEGCDQAYILKFDESTSIQKIEQEGEESRVWKGKECCKEYIKSFLASIPIRELEDDIKKGLHSSTPLHHRLQIELNCTDLLKEIELIVPEEEKRVKASVSVLTNEEIKEFFERKDESIVTAFNLTSALEVV